MIENCKTCMHYRFLKAENMTFCFHPKMYMDDPLSFSALKTNPDDYCNSYRKKEEVKRNDTQTSKDSR